MLHLAIECSAVAGSVALLNDDTVIAERQLPTNVGSVQSLAPAIAELLNQHASWPSSPLVDLSFSGTPHSRSQYRHPILPPIGLISVTNGPGSFTGLRAGLATAKMLGLAWRIPLVAVDTLHAIAAAAASDVQRLPSEPAIVAVMNAFRKQVFAAAWRLSCNSNDAPGFGLVPIAPTQVLDAATWQAQPLASLLLDTSVLFDTSILSDRSLLSSRRPAISPPAISDNPANSISSTAFHPYCVCGPGLRTYPLATIGDLVHSPEFAPQAFKVTRRSASDSPPHTSPHTPPSTLTHLLPPTSWDPTAGWVGRIGWHNYRAGQMVSAAGLSPNYVRRSAAEEATDAKQF